MKIAVIGTHSVGKTTVLEKLKNKLLSEGLNVLFIPEVVRSIDIKPNEDSKIYDQMCILMEQIRQESFSKDYDITISDRSVIDNYAYLYNLNEGHLDTAYEIIKKHLATYDYLIFNRIDPSFDIEKDGFRSTDQEFRNKIEEILEKLLSENSEYLKSNNVQVIDGNKIDIKEFVGEIRCQK